MGADHGTPHSSVAVLLERLREASREGDHGAAYRIGAMLYAKLEGGRARALLAGDVEVVNEIDRLTRQLDASLGQAGGRTPDRPRIDRRRLTP